MRLKLVRFSILIFLMLLFPCSSIDAGDISLRWDYAQDGTGVVFELENSQVQISSTDEPTSLPTQWLSVDNKITITRRSYTVKNVPEGGWYWRIRTKGINETYSDWSNYVFAVSKRNKPLAFGVKSN